MGIIAHIENWYTIAKQNTGPQRAPYNGVKNFIPRSTVGWMEQDWGFFPRLSQYRLRPHLRSQKVPGTIKSLGYDSYPSNFVVFPAVRAVKKAA